ncbi:MAG TPA: bifunctional demethylmenaquinone methyltransferase/2-methoxy-6-polyprenyl-1,4-benzoquinol methylase UbiE [Capsulimonadaceae bacterium]
MPNSLTDHQNKRQANAEIAEPSVAAVLDEPVGSPEKARYVQEMFDAIAPRYDLLNSVLSLRIHHLWRSFAARCASLAAGDSALDVCTGTGDFAVALKGIVGDAGRVVGIDFSEKMLESGAVKFDAFGIERQQADAMALPFADSEFDAAVVGFGIRNVTDPAVAVAEMARVVRPGGRVVILEFSQPTNPVFNTLYDIHSRYIMPALGGLISGRREAYAYLPESVKRWKTRTEMAEMLRSAGLVDVRHRDLTFGTVCVNVGTKAELAKGL